MRSESGQKRLFFLFFREKKNWWTVIGHNRRLITTRTLSKHLPARDSFGNLREWRITNYKRTDGRNVRTTDCGISANYYESRIARYSLALKLRRTKPPPQGRVAMMKVRVRLGDSRWRVSARAAAGARGGMGYVSRAQGRFARNLERCIARPPSSLRQSEHYRNEPASLARQAADWRVSPYIGITRDSIAISKMSRDVCHVYLFFFFFQIIRRIFVSEISTTTRPKSR